MARITVEFAIPSIKIDQTFLRALARCVEEEVRERQDLAESLKRRISELDADIRATDHDAREKRDALFSEKLEAATSLAQAKYTGIKYTFEAAGEKISFSSSQEIEGSPLLPKGIYRLTVRVSHSDTNFVDIDASFREFAGMGSVELSSDNEKSIQSFKASLTRLFEAARPGYHRFLLVGPIPGFVRGILGTIAGLSGWYVFTMPILHVAHVRPLLPVFGFLLGGALILFWIAGLFLCRYLYPIYEFSLGLHESTNTQIRKWASALIGALITGVAGNILYGYLH